MTKILIDEALVRQALDYLIAYEVKIDSEWGDCREMEQIDRDGDTPDIIIALRKVLSDAALDKKADNARELGLGYEQSHCEAGPEYCQQCKAEQPAPEPDPDELTIAYLNGIDTGKKRKPWVGLTDEEMRALKQKMVEASMLGIVTDFEYIRSIEAKLKEKNTKGGA